MDLALESAITQPDVLAVNIFNERVNKNKKVAERGKKQQKMSLSPVAVDSK